MDEVHASLGQETALPRDNLSVCQFSVHIMVANSQVAIATDNAPLPEVAVQLFGCPVVVPNGLSVSSSALHGQGRRKN